MKYLSKQTFGDVIADGSHDLHGMVFIRLIIRVQAILLTEVHADDGHLGELKFTWLGR